MQFRKSRWFFASLLAAFVVGCAENVTPTQISPIDAAASLSLSGSTTEYVVLTTGSVGSDFEAAVTALGGTIVRRHDAIGVMAVSGLSPSAAAALGARGDVKGVAADARLSWIPPVRSLAERAISLDATADAPAAQAAQNTAFFFNFYQWNMRQIDADAAWFTTDQGTGALVCVLDTGIDPGHLDLRPTVANPAGKVDFARSVSFVTGDPSVPGVPAFMDWNFHGTFVAGLISSNGFGIASVAPNARLCAVKVLNKNGVGAWSWIIAGIMHATDVRADVMNLSLGAFVHTKEPGGLVLIEALQRALDYASNKGTLVVASSGNDGLNLDQKEDVARVLNLLDPDNVVPDTPDWLHIPSQLQKVVSVGATAPHNQQNFDGLATYSNHGTTGNDMTAPGGDLLAGGQVRDLILAPCSRGVFIPDPDPAPPDNTLNCRGGTTYVFASGTSFASPHVAGAAAVFATNTKAYGGDNTTLVKRYDARFLEGCLEKGLERPNVPNSDVLHGKGRLNVERSMLCGSSPKPAPTSAFTAR
jgi:subtilisin family serine protease